MVEETNCLSLIISILPYPRTKRTEEALYFFKGPTQSRLISGGEGLDVAANRLVYSPLGKVIFFFFFYCIAVPVIFESEYNDCMFLYQIPINLGSSLKMENMPIFCRSITLPSS